MESPHSDSKRTCLYLSCRPNDRKKLFASCSLTVVADYVDLDPVVYDLAGDVDSHGVDKPFDRRFAEAFDRPATYTDCVVMVLDWRKAVRCRTVGKGDFAEHSGFDKYPDGPIHGRATDLREVFAYLFGREALPSTS